MVFLAGSGKSSARSAPARLLHAAGRDGRDWPPMANYYSLLQIDRDADSESIRHAFRVAVKACHPDLHPDLEEAPERLQEVLLARRTLLDPQSRAAHDRELAEAEAFAAALLTKNAPTSPAESLAQPVPEAMPPPVPVGPLDLPEFDPAYVRPAEFRRWRRRLPELRRDFQHWQEKNPSVASLRCWEQKFLYAVLHSRAYHDKEELVSHWLEVEAREVREACEASDAWRQAYATLRPPMRNRRPLARLSGWARRLFRRRRQPATT